MFSSGSSTQALGRHDADDPLLRQGWLEGAEIRGFQALHGEPAARGSRAGVSRVQQGSRQHIGARFCKDTVAFHVSRYRRVSSWVEESELR